jgi:Holliday junction DNA helicase RuvA
MIGRIQGVVITKQAPGLLLDVSGIGYEILVSLNTFFEIPDLGESVTLHTHFLVRDDVQQLYGFSQSEERILFRNLIKVNGVGPKMALAILSGMTTDDFSHCVRNNDITALTKVPGVGKKTAARLLIEMRDRMAHVSNEEILPGRSTEVRVDMHQEAERALIALGYKPQDATKMMAHIDMNRITSAEQLIRLALKSVL